ncbi:Gfo/Idh/MocA family protein [Streptomyces fuscichromogenes]|uniref:Oxidoreductase n=1 Tax=Streptomyces fuscichromogenes TaxID=1324013 RepID=A0A917XMG4_9ACTN|nr:Gfo/Idh/MocA family oxidoreductase [Streptomyces fuscichromogenes]GGN40592.1 putative oxidoreductase [Streptomyces fuscichromogenes]
MSDSRPLDEVRWAIVGTGAVSRHIAADLAAVPEAGRAAVLSRSLARARAFADEFGFSRAFDDIDVLVADSQVDAIYIATPHALHAPMALQAIAAGKHVLVEKPLAVNATEARRIAEAAQRHGVFAMEAMWMKFNPSFRAFVDQARAGRIGDIRAVRGYFGLPLGPADSTLWSAELSSSTLLDQGIYPVTLALELLGTPSGITADGHVRADGVDLTEYVTLRYDGGQVAHLAASMVQFIEPTASVSGTAGWMTIPAPFMQATQYATHATDGALTAKLFSPEISRFDREGHGYVPMLRTVTDAIRRGDTEHEWHPLRASVEVFDVLDSIRSALASESPRVGG